MAEGEGALCQLSGEQITGKKSSCILVPFSKMEAHEEETQENRRKRTTKENDSPATDARIGLESSTKCTCQSCRRRHAHNLVGIAIEHVVKRHMLPIPYGKSYFISSDVNNVCSMVAEVITRSDQTCPHRDDEGKTVHKKNFGRQVGVLGYSQKKCYCVTVIWDDRRNALVTAFPTVK